MSRPVRLDSTILYDEPYSVLFKRQSSSKRRKISLFSKGTDAELLTQWIHDKEARYQKIPPSYKRSIRKGGRYRRYNRSSQARKSGNAAPSWQRRTSPRKYRAYSRARNTASGRVVTPAGILKPLRSNRRSSKRASQDGTRKRRNRYRSGEKKHLSVGKKKKTGSALQIVCYPAQIQIYSEARRATGLLLSKVLVCNVLMPPDVSGIKMKSVDFAFQCSLITPQASRFATNSLAYAIMAYQGQKFLSLGRVSPVQLTLVPGAPDKLSVCSPNKSCLQLTREMLPRNRRGKFKTVGKKKGEAFQIQVYVVQGFTDASTSHVATLSDVRTRVLETMKGFASEEGGIQEVKSIKSVCTVPDKQSFVFTHRFYKWYDVAANESAATPFSSLGLSADQRI